MSRIELDWLDSSFCLMNSIVFISIRLDGSLHSLISFRCNCETDVSTEKFSGIRCSASLFSSLFLSLSLWSQNQFYNSFWREHKIWVKTYRQPQQRSLWNGFVLNVIYLQLCWQIPYFQLKFKMNLLEKWCRDGKAAASPAPATKYNTKMERQLLIFRCEMRGSISISI